MEEELEEKQPPFWQQNTFWWTLCAGYLIGLLVAYLIIMDKALLKKSSQPRPIDVHLHVIDVDTAQPTSTADGDSEAVGSELS